jgi:hypothetical protein
MTMSQKHESDPLLEELDEVRRRIWEECGKDRDKYVAMLLEGQEELRRQGWKFVAPPEKQGKSAA